MIELIFAIVVIAITVLSLPMMTQVTSTSSERNIVQEAIFAASTELNQVVSYYWDENSLQDDNILAKVVSNGDCNETTKLRPGHINQPYHRRCIDDTTLRPSTTLGSDGGDLDDLDDIDQTQHQIFTLNPASATGYKEVYTSQLTVAYSDFGDETAADQNIKRITVTIRDADNNITTILRTYSANIGEIDYYKRRYE